ncbi:DsbA family protein [Armatimonas sp.]|uniref:DsbA family protein n=1 Tax=Armatimonas sp. TaxID=1872638 RepID=UPI0037510C3A
MKSETKLLVVMGAIVALGAGFLTLTRDPTLDPPKPPPTPAPLTEARFAELAKGTRHFKGPADARFTVIEFADFQCPSCRFAYETAIKDLGTKFPQVRFGFRHFPLERPHPFAMPAAVMSEVAGRQAPEKFWESYEALMKGKDELVDTAFIEKAAVEAKLDMERYKKEKNDAALSKLVQSDRDTGISFGVNETPTFFVHDNKTKRTVMVTGYRQLYPEIKDIPGLPTPMPSSDGSAPPPPEDGSAPRSTK